MARGATLRRDLVNIPARFAAPARKPTLHLPAHWPRQIQWKTLWDNAKRTSDRRAPPNVAALSLTGVQVVGPRNTTKQCGVANAGGRSHRR